MRAFDNSITVYRLTHPGKAFSVVIFIPCFKTHFATKCLLHKVIKSHLKGADAPFRWQS